MDTIIVCCHFCEIHGPSVIFCTRAYVEELDSSHVDLMPQDETNHCVGCSFESRPRGFVCTDKETGYKYVTSKVPLAGNVGPTLIQQSCVRSLSCEVYPQGREGIIYFGDSQRGHVLSCCFVLKDSQARGFQRTYSFLVIDKEKEHLMTNWSFYVQHLTRIVQQLKEKASAVHDKELRQTSCQEKRSIRLNNVVQQVGGRGRNPQNTQRSSSKARSLTELTNDNSIYASLHLEFTWILKAVQVKVEKPMFDAQFFTTSSLPDTNEALGVESINCSIRWLYSLLGKEKFRVAAYHTIVGSQVILRSKNKQLSKSMLMSLSQLLPKGCVKAIFDSDQYFDVGKCNLLGLLDKVPIVPEGEYLLIDVSCDEPQTSSSEQQQHSTKFTLHTIGKLPEKLPKFLADLERILTDTSFSDATLNTYLISAKEEWINKSKIVYAYIKGKKEPPKKPEHAMKLYQTINAQEADVALIRFWMTAGLTLHFKTNVFMVNADIEPMMEMN